MALLQVEAAERYERFWGPRADASLCVTAAMQRELAKGYGVMTMVPLPSWLASSQCIWLIASTVRRETLKGVASVQSRAASSASHSFLLCTVSLSTGSQNRAAMKHRARIKSEIAAQQVGRPCDSVLRSAAGGDAALDGRGAAHAADGTGPGSATAAAPRRLLRCTVQGAAST